MNKKYSHEKKIHFESAKIDVTVVVTPGENKGSQKEVYLDKEGRYAVAVYATALGHAAKHSDIDKFRLSSLISDIKKQDVQDHWKQMICFPIDWIFDKQGRLVFLLPRIPSSFTGRFLGEAHANATIWLESPFFANALFHESPESGDFLMHLRACRKLAAAVGRIHMLGWIHTDLSANNVLIDPINGVPYIIDLDGSTKDNRTLTLLEIKTVGTAGFIAPEIFKAFVDNSKVYFSVASDLHPLAIHIYSLLLHRHPFKGVHRALERKWGAKYDNVASDDLYLSLDPQYIEAPNDPSCKHLDHIMNRYCDHYWHIVDKKPTYQKVLKAMPDWIDITKFSARKICGPYLAELFNRAFIDGITNPMKRPSTREWQDAISKTINLLQVCPKCYHGGMSHFVYDGEGAAICPFCGRKAPSAPFLTFHYFSRFRGEYLKGQESYLTCYDGRSLFVHQIEGTPIDENVKPVVMGKIYCKNGKWMIHNLALEAVRRFKDSATFAESPTIPFGCEIVLEEDALFHLGNKGDLELIMSCNFSK